MLKIRTADVPSESWSGAPLKVGLITDIHIGGFHVNAARVKAVVAQMNLQSPDIILLPGDFINGHAKREQRGEKESAEISEGLLALGQLRAPLGVFASMGNHDGWYGVDSVREQLTAAGITVLENQSQIIGERLCVVGLEDDYTGKPNAKAFEGCGDYPAISLMHTPDSFYLVPPQTALSVAGHTHGGQINLPFYGRRVTATNIGRDYVYGLIEVARSPLFVSAGVGTSILPARFRVPPEIVLLTLKTPD